MQASQDTPIPTHRARWSQFNAEWSVLLGIFLAVGVLYYVAGRLALLVLSEPEGVAVFWPASGIAAGLAAVLRKSARIPIALAVAAATIVANVQARSSLPATMVFAACNAMECLIFVWGMRWLDKDRTQLESLSSFAAFVAAAALAAGIAALPAAFVIQILGLSKSPLLAIWSTWFKSDALGILTMAPAIITLPRLLRYPPRIATIAEGCLGFAVTLILAAFAISIRQSDTAWPVIAPTTVLFPSFLWLAGRAPAWFSTLGALSVSAMVVSAALAGMGRFGGPSTPLPERLLAAEMFVLTMSLAVLTLAAMFARIRNTALALQSSEERLRLALAAGRMYAFDFDQERGIVQRAGGLLDRLKLPVYGTLSDYRASLDPADRADFEAMLASLSPAEPRSLRVLHLHTRDGEILTVEHRAEAVFGEDGRLLNIRGTCTDITAREAARLALEQSEAQLRGAMRAGRVFAFSYEPVSHRVERSENAADILGVSLEEAKFARNLFIEHIHPDDRKALENYRKRLSPANPYTSEKFRFVRPGGGTVWLELTATGEHDAQGRLVRLRGLCRDVTESKLAEERQAELVKELNHRVKNALTTVNDVIELSRGDNDTIDGFVEKVDGRVRAMTRTHDRLTSNQWAGVNVTNLVEDELEAYRTADNCRVDGPALVLSPRVAQSFALTLHELATNAAKHGALIPANGKVDVHWRIVGDAWQGQRLELSWREHCVRPVEVPKRESYGLTAIRKELPHWQDATVDIRFTPTGLHCDIGLALSPPTAPNVLEDTETGAAVSSSAVSAAPR